VKGSKLTRGLVKLPVGALAGRAAVAH
jgi:hypothetical protein